MLRSSFRPAGLLLALVALPALSFAQATPTPNPNDTPVPEATDTPAN